MDDSFWSDPFVPSAFPAKTQFDTNDSFNPRDHVTTESSLERSLAHLNADVLIYKPDIEEVFDPFGLNN